MALARLTDAQIRNGIEALLSSGLDHVPTLPQFITLCRSAREYANPLTPRIEAPQMNRWMMSANRHLLGYIAHHSHGKCFFDAGQTRILVEAKNAWAEDMQADDANDGKGIPVAIQRKAWDECMANARKRGATGTPNRLSVPVRKTPEAIKRGLRPWEVWDTSPQPKQQGEFD